MPYVDYDTIINVQTLSWFSPDLDLLFDRANHIDCDVHVSLLFDVGDDTPEEYTGVRVGFPAGREERIGYLTPPASPRKFKEQALTGTEHIDARQYIGDIKSAPTGAKRGIRQTLKMQNPTGVSEVSVIDSPMADEASDILDATALVDSVRPISINVDSSSIEAERSLFDRFDRFDYIISVTDDVLFDYDGGMVEGQLYVEYDTDRIHIAKANVQFFHGLDPYYWIAGLGSLSGARSPLKLYIRQEAGRRGMLNLRNQAGIRLFLLINDRKTSASLTDYRWISIDYGFSDYNWRNDRVSGTFLLKQDIWCATQAIPRYAPLESIGINNIPSYESAYPWMGPWITSPSQSRVLQYSFGRVLSGAFTDGVNPAMLVWITSPPHSRVSAHNILEPSSVRGFDESDDATFMTLASITSAAPSLAYVGSW